MSTQTASDPTMWTGNLHANVMGTFLGKPRVAPNAAALRAAGANVAFVGFPWDVTCISRTGTNFGPRGLREASEQFLSYNANTGVDLTETLTIADCGDITVVPGNSIATQNNAERLIGTLLAADVLPVI